MRSLKTALGRLRIIGWWEGVSFLVLLGVAMPLKYFAGVPMAVKIMGWLHGVLFFALCFALADAKRSGRWPVREAAIYFIAALLPLGPFLVDRRLKEKEVESTQNK